MKKNQKQNDPKPEVKLPLKERMKHSIIENDPLKKKGSSQDLSKGYRKQGA